jgi:integrase
VLAFAGLRVSEALALRWQDVDFGEHLLHVPGTKTTASRQPVPMTDDLETELRKHRARYPGVGDALVFRTATGKPQDRHKEAARRSAVGLAFQESERPGHCTGPFDRGREPSLAVPGSCRSRS